MELAGAIKRAPRWAWVTAAGIGLGAAGIKLWTNRGKEPESATATEVTADGVPLPTSTGNPIATIVPPVIIGQGTGDQNSGLGMLQEAYFSALGGVIGTYQDILGPLMTSNQALLLGNAQTIQELALAGSAPNSSTTAPPQIMPFPVPVPATPQALPTGGGMPASPCGSCKPPYPFCNESNKKCYTVACASGNSGRRKGRWHLYANSSLNTWMGPTC